jgi:hypothetical protein
LEAPAAEAEGAAAAAALAGRRAGAIAAGAAARLGTNADGAAARFGAKAGAERVNDGDKMPPTEPAEGKRIPKRTPGADARGAREIRPGSARTKAALERAANPANTATMKSRLKRFRAMRDYLKSAGTTMRAFSLEAAGLRA